jgi:hypothetical protein
VSHAVFVYRVCSIEVWELMFLTTKPWRTCSLRLTSAILIGGLVITKFLKKSDMGEWELFIVPGNGIRDVSLR